MSLQDAAGRTALHMAALHGHIQVVDYLLGHDIEWLHDLLGLNPLDYARKAINNSLVIVGKLESRLAKLNGNSD